MLARVRELLHSNPKGLQSFDGSKASVSPQRAIKECIPVLFDTEDATIFGGLVSTLDTREEHENAEIASEACVSQMFEGACVDLGAQQSVIRQNQADLYWKSFGGERRSTDSKTTYRFVNTVFHSLGVLHVTIPITGAYFIDVYPKIVKADVPFLLGLDILTQVKS